MQARCTLARRLSSLHNKSAFEQSRSRAFTLVEFLVVISVVVILTSMLMPALSQARRAGARLHCMNNMRQIGAGLITYADDWNNRLPPSSYVPMSAPRIGEMMCLTTAVLNGEAKPDGLGILLSRMGGYVSDERCLFCASHHGQHDYERYIPDFAHPAFTQRVFSNYQYRGDMDFTDIARPRRRSDPLSSRAILLADGFRSRTDFNHRTGSNRLKGDGSVDWWADAGEYVVHNAPNLTDDSTPQPLLELYLTMWARIDKLPQD